MIEKDDVMLPSQRLLAPVSPSSFAHPSQHREGRKIHAAEDRDVDQQTRDRLDEAVEEERALAMR